MRQLVSEVRGRRLAKEIVRRLVNPWTTPSCSRHVKSRGTEPDLEEDFVVFAEVPPFCTVNPNYPQEGERPDMVLAGARVNKALSLILMKPRIAFFSLDHTWRW